MYIDQLTLSTKFRVQIWSFLALFFFFFNHPLMSDNSSSRVTVTLGRNGRVVKRAGELPDDGFSNGLLMAGSKRSVRDRLGADSYDRSQHRNKRQRVESFGTSSLNDVRLDKHDLRFKLMQKSMVGQSHDNDSHGNVDLREKLLSKASRLSVHSKTMRPPEATVSRRQHVPEQADVGTIRRPVLDPRDTGRGAGIMGRFPSSRNTSDLSLLDTGRTYSSWSLDNIRRRSPERLLHPSTTSRLSPERNREELQRRPSIRAINDGRSNSLRISPSRPVSSPYLTRSSVPDAPMKSVAPFTSHYPPTSGIIQKLPSMGDEHSTVDSFLHSLGLEKYAIYFKAEEIDMNALRQLGDQDLKELGIPMGPRKKILQSVVPRFRRYQ